MLTISENKKSLKKNGQDFFYLADTCWSAFTNITDEEWDYYLYKRKVQGFNSIQINILPQWDASETELNRAPFVNGDPMQLNEAYFTHAKAMCQKAVDEGFQLALVVLWCNYVPGTWASNMFQKGILPFDFIEGYINKVHETFTEFEPLYVISGDTDFPTEETVDYYVKAAETLRPLAKDCLFTTHIKGRYSEIPEELLQYLDILFYQSGHNAKDLTMPYSLSETMQEKYPNKPLINSEPCYEEMGYSGKMYGRWTQDDIRRAAWVSVLSGASAGITYGAAGIYSWQKTGKAFMKDLGEAFDTPKSWEEAMNFPGAWDYGFVKEVFEKLNLYDLTPAQDLVLNDTTEIRAAKTNKKLLVYIPHNTKVRLAKDYSGHEVKAIDLTAGRIATLASKTKDGKTTLDMHPFSRDALYVISEK